MSQSIIKYLKLTPCWPKIKSINQKIFQKGFQVVVAGGAVRDSLLKKIPKDIDLATSARPEEILKIFPQARGDFAKYGVAFIPLDKKQTLEITSFRSDSSYKDGRRPQFVSYSNMKEDACRRDFTVNALFYDIHKKKLIDFVKGRQDLQNKILRTVGEAKKRFEEDHLRILRAVRLAHQLEFQIDRELKQTLLLSAKKVKNVSKERVLEELVKMFSCGRMGLAIQSLKEYELFTYIFPGLNKSLIKKSLSFWNKKFSCYQDTAFIWTVLALPFFHFQEKNFESFLKSLLVPKKTIKKSLSYLKAVQTLISCESSLTEKFMALSGQKKPAFELSQSLLEIQSFKKDIRKTAIKSKKPIRLRGVKSNFTSIQRQKFITARSLNKIIQEFDKRQIQGMLPTPLVRGSDLLKLTPRPIKQNFSFLLKQALEYQMENPKAKKSEILKKLTPNNKLRGEKNN